MTAVKTAAPVDDDQRVADLEALTGHRFADRALALKALTHPSYAHENPGAAHYEVLEFLGDAVLQLAVTDLLEARGTALGEGALTNHRQHMVRGQTLAELGRGVGLDHLLRLGRSEASKPVVQDSIVEGAVEAVLGAVYRDAGFAPCLTLVQRWIAPRLFAALDNERAAFRDKPAKNLLQELMHQHDLGDPVWPDTHEALPGGGWRTTLVVDGEAFDGEGAKKREAEEAAAKLALAALTRRLRA